MIDDRLFETVAREVSAREAFEKYSPTPITRSGKALCPWHSDRHPSMGFFTRRDGIGACRCFSCNQGGNAIDLVSQILHVSKLEAATRIARDFHVMLAPTQAGTVTVQRRTQATQRKTDVETARRWHDDITNALTAALSMATDPARRKLLSNELALARARMNANNADERMLSYWQTNRDTFAADVLHERD